MHGAHKSRNVLLGATHPQYRNAGHTKIERQERSDSSLRFALIEQLGWHLNMFTQTLLATKKSFFTPLTAERRFPFQEDG